MKKLIISDMDGTLLKKDKTISPKTVETVEQARKQGIEFTIGTGRIYPVVLDTVDTMKITQPLILCNGAIIQDPVTKEVYFSKTLENEVAIKILEIVSKAGLYFYYYTIDSINAREVKYITAIYERQNRNSTRPDKIKINITDDIIYKAENDEIFKIVIINEDAEKFEKVKEELKHIEKNITITSSFWNNIEIVASGVNKGIGVKFIAEKLGLSHKDIMCIGDEENDESMIEVAGFSVAMGNANETLKKMADFVTDDNENEGISKAIMEFAKR